MRDEFLTKKRAGVPVLFPSLHHAVLIAHHFRGTL